MTSSVIRDAWNVAEGSVIPDRLKILIETGSVIHGAREGEYGSPENNFARIAALWNAFLMNRAPEMEYPPISTWEVAAMMMLMKVARLQSTDGGHHDSWVDAVGYAANGYECTRED